MDLGGYISKDFISLRAVHQFHQAVVPDASSCVGLLSNFRISWAVQKDVSHCLWCSVVADTCIVVHYIESLEITAEATVPRKELGLYEVGDDVFWKPCGDGEEMSHCVVRSQ